METKRTFPYFKFYNRSGMQTYLEEMAQKGWLLTNAAEFGWHFRRIEPKKLRFSVIYFPQASLYDPEPTEKQKQFQEFCAHTGWKLASANAQVQFFYNEAEDAVPIETDAVLEAENIHKAVKQRFLPGYYIELFLSLLNLVFLTATCVTNPIPFLASGGSLLFYLCWFLVGVLSLTEITGYYSWYRKAKRSAKAENCFAEPKGHPEHFLFIIPILLFGIGFFVADKTEQSLALPAALIIAGTVLFIAVIGAFLFLGILRLLKKRNVPAGVTRIMSLLGCALGCLLLFIFLLGGVMNFLFQSPYQHSKKEAIAYEYKGDTFYAYQDTLPFTVSDLIETDYTEYSRRCSTKDSFFLSYLEASERPRYDALTEPELEYRIVWVKVPFLYDLCLDAMLKDFSHNYGTPEPEIPGWEKALAVDATPWGANKAYRLSLGDETTNRYLLCYEDTLVEIKFDWSLSETAKEQAGKLLQKAKPIP